MNILKTSDFLNDFPDPSAQLITLKNKNGLVAQFTNYGARWVSMWVPDRNGRLEDILLGFDTLSGYSNAGEKYHGAIVGRVCGRIQNATFTLDGINYYLAPNDVYGKPFRNHLHGGVMAFHNQFWKIKNLTNDEGEQAVVLTLFSKEGDEGYPGNLSVEVTYTLTSENVLRMECRATTDQPTPVNLTNHAFFNLQGNQSKEIGSQFITIHSSQIIECDKELIPTGRLQSVDTHFADFRTAKTIQTAIQTADQQVQKDNGFSIAFALDKNNHDITLAASLEDKDNGRKMEIYTNQLSMQVYNGYFMDGTDIGKNNTPYYASAGIAFEAQGYPDAPNQPEFSSVIVDANRSYYHHTAYRFFTS